MPKQHLWWSNRNSTTLPPLCLFEEYCSTLIVIGFVWRRGFEAGWGFAVTKTYGLDKVLTVDLYLNREDILIPCKGHCDECGTENSERDHLRSQLRARPGLVDDHIQLEIYFSPFLSVEKYSWETLCSIRSSQIHLTWLFHVQRFQTPIKTLKNHIPGWN